MTPLQSHKVRTYGTPALLAALAYFAGTQRFVQYFQGAPKEALFCAAGLSSLGTIGSGLLPSSHGERRRRVCIVAGLVLSGVATHYGFRKKIPVKTSLRFVAAEGAIVVAAEVLTSKVLQDRITSTRESFNRNCTKNHLMGTFGTPLLFVAMAFFAKEARKPLLYAAGLSGVGVMGSGVVLSGPE